MTTCGEVTMTQEEVSKEVDSVVESLIKLGNFANERFTAAEVDESHDHCHGYRCGYAIGLINQARDAVAASRFHLMQLARKSVDEKEEREGV